MITTRLIQRVERPRKIFRNKEGEPIVPFTFGAHSNNAGGLKPEALELLLPVLSFSYMGAGEYEMGNVPRAFLHMAELHAAGKLTAFTIRILRSTIKTPAWGKLKEKTDHHAYIYVLGNVDDIDEIHERLVYIAQDRRTRMVNGPWSTRVWLRDAPMLGHVLKFDDPDFPTVGGLEINNGFFYTVDKVMFENMKAIFPGVHEQKTIRRSVRKRPKAAAGAVPSP